MFNQGMIIFCCKSPQYLLLITRILTILELETHKLWKIMAFLNGEKVLYPFMIMNNVHATLLYHFREDMSDFDCMLSFTF